MLRLFLAAMLAAVATPAQAAYLLIEASGPASGTIYPPEGDPIEWTGGARATAIINLYGGSPACFGSVTCRTSGKTLRIVDEGDEYWPTLELTFDHPLTGIPITTDGFVTGLMRTRPSVGDYPFDYQITGFGEVADLTIAIIEGEADDYFSVSMAGSIPEPATWAMMIAGFGLLGGALRRQQRAAVAFA